jgi:hypothetical protein
MYIPLTHIFMESAGITLAHHYEKTSNLMEISVKACDTPLNIFGIPHGCSIQTSVSQPGLIRTPLGVPREIVEQINILKYQKFQIALKISRKLVSGN